MTEKTPEEQAVIEAAEALGAGFVEYTNLPATGWNDDDKLLKLVEAVRQSIDALRASRKPKGVRPEVVEPGTLFRFAPGTGVNNENIICTFILVPPGPRPMWLQRGEHVARAFIAEDRIIPIEEEGECEHEGAS